MKMNEGMRRNRNKNLLSKNKEHRFTSYEGDSPRGRETEMNDQFGE
jgi:hypothetical protein